MDRPSLLRRFIAADASVVFGALLSDDDRPVRGAKIESDESRKMIRAHITLSARAYCVSTESARARAQNARASSLRWMCVACASRFCRAERSRRAAMRDGRERCQPRWLSGTTARSGTPV
jgi:hypothetical protein